MIRLQNSAEHGSIGTTLVSPETGLGFDICLFHPTMILSEVISSLVILVATGDAIH